MQGMVGGAMGELYLVVPSFRPHPQSVIIPFFVAYWISCKEKASDTLKNKLRKYV